MIVAGEAGIGKTRLVGAFADRVGSMGGRVLTGGCLPLGTGGLPYAPFVEAFRDLFRELDPGALPALLGPNRGELARLMPELRSRPDRPTAADPGGGASGWQASSDDRFAQVRLFELVLGVVDRLARDMPAVVRHRGPPVGRSVDAGPARLPRPQPARRTRPAGGHDPDRRARAAPRGDDPPRRARARGACRSHRPRAARSRRPRAPDRRRARPDARSGPGGSGSGSAPGATRSTPSRSWPPPARRATASCRPVCATSCWLAWRPCPRPARRCSGWPRRPAPGSTTSW